MYIKEKLNNAKTVTIKSSTSTEKKITRMSTKILMFLLTLVLTFGLFGCNNTKNTDEITSLNDLKGKVVYNVGAANVPDLTFRYILKKNNIEYVSSDTAVAGKVALAYADAPQMAGLLQTGKADAVISGEPSATKIAAETGKKIVLDIQDLYGGGFPQALLVVKNDYLAQNSDYIGNLCERLAQSTKWIESNLEAGKAALKAAGSTANALLTVDSAKNSNTVFKPATTEKTAIETYFNAIKEVGLEFDIDPIGGNLPTDAFYSRIPTGKADATGSAKIYMPDGAPALVFSELITNGFTGAQFNIFQTSQMADILKEFDLAVLPSNAAALQFTKAKLPITVLAVVTYGNLYMVG